MIHSSSIFNLFMLLLLGRTRLAFRTQLLKNAFFANLLAACERGFGHELRVARDRDLNLFSQEDENHWSPIIMASKGGHVVLVDWLCKLPVSNVNPRVSETHSALRAASLGGHLHVCKLLIDHGANLNALSAGKRTPLMGASMNGHRLVVRLLLDMGADRNIVNSTGESALDLAKNEETKGAFA